MVIASGHGRNSFLRAESFRMLSNLYNAANQGVDDTYLFLENLKQCSVKYVKSLETALLDEEMTKTKRAREIIKCAEKMIKFMFTHGDILCWEATDGLKEAAHKLSETSESSAVKNSIKQLVEDIDKGFQTFKEANMPQPEDDVMSPSSATKKKSKKKKKGKKKK